MRADKLKTNITIKDSLQCVVGLFYHCTHFLLIFNSYRNMMILIIYGPFIGEQQ